MLCDYYLTVYLRSSLLSNFSFSLNVPKQHSTYIILYFIVSCLLCVDITNEFYFIFSTIISIVIFLRNNRNESETQKATTHFIASMDKHKTET